MNYKEIRKINNSVKYATRCHGFNGTRELIIGSYKLEQGMSFTMTRFALYSCTNEPLIVVLDSCVAKAKEMFIEELERYTQFLADTYIYGGMR